DVYKIKDINLGASSSTPEHFTVYKNKLFFDAHNGAGRKLWVIDGLSSPVLLAPQISPVPGPLNASNGMIVCNGSLYLDASFNTNGYELWKMTDTTSYAKIYPTEVKEMVIYPNPSNGVFTVHTSANSSAKIEVYNTNGKIVYSGQLVDETQVVDLNELEAGGYLVRVISGNSIEIQRLVIQK
ncbi:MAG: T9SS type A sorting domain-containing protein, partial [Crocinitomicaceae bacterium]|nr:T9SS type A sorting domain-containing protein [Crocinitomicaceae bacterium]